MLESVHLSVAMILVASCAVAADVPLRTAATGHLLVTADVGGKAGAFVVDTGSTRTLLSGFFWNDLKDRPPSIGAESIATTGGSVMVQIVVMPSVAVGEMRRENFEVRLTDLRTLERALGEPVAGVLGMDFLDGMVADFHPPHLTLSKAPAETPEGAIRFETDRDRHIRITVTVGGHALPGILDTGARHTSINWPAAAALGFSRGSAELKLNPAAPAGLDGHDVSVAETPVLEVGFGPIIRKMPIGIADFGAFQTLGWGNTPAVIVGTDFLDGVRWILSPSGRWLRLAYM
jgi:predicted aspartyl protease